MGKKRKVELDLEVERTMYSSFVTAANAVSQLYTQGVQQQRRVAAAASRSTLEKVLNFVLREGGGAEHIPKAVLIQFLQHEYENADHQESAVPQPQLLMPFGAQGLSPSPEDSQDSQQPKQPSRQMSGGNMNASPAHRARMDDQQQSHQQQHQQLQQHQQQLQMQQQQQLQHTQHQHPHVCGTGGMQMQGGMMQGGGTCFTGQADAGMQHSMFSLPGSGMH